MTTISTKGFSTGALARLAAASVLTLLVATALSTPPAFAASDRGEAASGGNAGGNGNGGGNDGEHGNAGGNGNGGENGNGGGNDGDHGNAGGNGNGNGGDGGDDGDDNGNGNGNGNGPSAQGVESSGGAAGGNGPSEKGVEASGGVAGGNPPKQDEAAIEDEESAKLAGLNASHASANARAHAAAESAVGRLAGYEAFILAGDFEAAGHALDQAARGAVTLDVVKEVNANLGLIVSDEQAMQILSVIAY
jgi:hypothetical protein